MKKIPSGFYSEIFWLRGRPEQPPGTPRLGEEEAGDPPPGSVPLPVRPLYIHSCMCLVAVSVPTPRASGLCLFAVQCARACAFCIRTTLFALAANCFRSRDVTHPAGRPEPPTCRAVCSLGETAFADRDVLALEVRLRGRCSRQRESALTNSHSSERQTPRYELCSEHRIAVNVPSERRRPSAVAVYHAVMLRVVSTYARIVSTPFTQY